MAEERTYLELSEAGGGSHKFYEVLINNTELSIRYGRIGDSGQVQTKNFTSFEKAKADAQKKINEKLKKGYEPATQGVRQKRTVTRRSAMLAQYAASSTNATTRATTPASAIKQAPILWKFESKSGAFGIFVNDSHCWMGNEEGNIFALTHDGEVRLKYKLPEGVKCIVADDEWLYAGCDDGNIYDLTGKVPRVAYEIAPDVDIYWLDIFDGVLAVSDAKGDVTVINHEDESQWTKRSRGDRGWMVRTDEIGVYHGHGNGVTMYDWEDGRELWHKDTQGAVLFGWQEEANLYAGTSRGVVHSFSKSGAEGARYVCDGPIFSCAASENGKYVFAANNWGSIFCFNDVGERLWVLNTGCGGAYSMQYFKERLYIVTMNGSLACIDASEEAIRNAQAGTVPQAIQIEAPQVEAVSSMALETTRDTSAGVMVECFKEGGKLRVRVISDGFNKELRCQFPKGIREEGARYMVDEVREARGGFYRVLGNIRKLA
jgi:predicted DNA-binding WGR domain protein